MAKVADQSALRKNVMIGHEITDFGEAMSARGRLLKQKQDMELAEQREGRAQAEEARKAEKHPLEVKSKKIANEAAGIKVAEKKREINKAKELDDLAKKLEGTSDPDMIRTLGRRAVTIDAKKGAELLASYDKADDHAKRAMQQSMDRLGSIGYALTTADNPKQFFNQTIEAMRKQGQNDLADRLSSMDPGQGGYARLGQMLMAQATEADKMFRTYNDWKKDKEAADYYISRSNYYASKTEAAKKSWYLDNATKLAEKTAKAMDQEIDIGALATDIATIAMGLEAEENLSPEAAMARAWKMKRRAYPNIDEAGEEIVPGDELLD